MKMWMTINRIASNSTVCQKAHLNGIEQEKFKILDFNRFFLAHKSCLYCLENANDYLVCGAVNEIIVNNEITLK
jgi:hypothetical protein